MDKFPPMRRKDRELSKQQALEILKSGDYGILATFNGEYPYAVPVNYAFDGEYIYIHCAKEGHKIENLKKFSNVCFTVVKSYEILPDELSTAYESVIVFGKASIIENEDEKRRALETIGKKYSDDLQKIQNEISSSLDRVNIIKITIDNISGKSRKR